MRISDDRYRRERERMELALRFLRHEARAAAPSRQVAAPGGLLHPLAAAAAGERRAGEPAVDARGGAAAGCAGGRGAPGTRAWGAPVRGVRGLPCLRAGGADLLRARGVPRHRADAGRPAAARRLRRLWEPDRHRALPGARGTVPLVRRSTESALAAPRRAP